MVLSRIIIVLHNCLSGDKAGLIASVRVERSIPLEVGKQLPLGVERPLPLAKKAQNLGLQYP